MKQIIFRPISKEVEKLVVGPKASKQYVPNWYKDTPKFDKNNFSFIDNKVNSTFKMCMPFLDTFLTGYIQETWTDIYIDSTKESEIEYRYSCDPQIITTRKGTNYFPNILEFHKDELSWKQPWIPKIPNGYSMMYTHPLNRYDLPFLSLTGIIDNDKYYMETHAFHPFFIKKNFKGIIPAGTPMFQMIPIKRDSWQSMLKPYDENLQIKFLEIRKFFINGYKNLYWQKKKYF